MADIRVIQGSCGISYVDENGARRFGVKSCKDGPFSYDNQKAERLVRLGVAEYVQEPKETQPGVFAQGGNAQDGGAGRSREEVLFGKTNKELIALAESMEIDVSKCKTKKEYVETILAAEASQEEDKRDAEGAADGDVPGGGDDNSGDDQLAEPGKGNNLPE